MLERAADDLLGAPAGQQLERLVDVGDRPAARLRVVVGDHDAVVGGGERALVQVEHRGAAAVAQVQRDLAGERGDVGHQARVGARAGRELQLQHALAGAAGDERDGDVRAVGDGRARERGAAGEVLVGLRRAPAREARRRRRRRAGPARRGRPAAPRRSRRRRRRGRRARRAPRSAGPRAAGRRRGGRRSPAGRTAAAGRSRRRSGPARRRARAGRRRAGARGSGSCAAQPCAACAAGPASGSVSTSATPARSQVSRTARARASPGGSAQTTASASPRRERGRRARRGRAAPSRRRSPALPLDAPSTSTSARGGLGISVDDERAQGGGSRS